MLYSIKRLIEIDKGGQRWQYLTRGARGAEKRADGKVLCMLCGKRTQRRRNTNPGTVLRHQSRKPLYLF